MKKIFIGSAIVFMALIIYIAIENKTSINNIANWNKKILKNISESNFQFPLCQKKQHIHKANILSKDKLINIDSAELPFNIIFKGIGDTDLSPLIFNNEIAYFCQRHCLQIYSIEDNKILWEQNFIDTNIIATTLPIYKDKILSFFILESPNNTNSNLYKITNIIYNDKKIESNSITTIKLSNTQYIKKTSTEVLFFIVNKNKIIIPVYENNKSQILEYSTSGDFCKSYGYGNIIIPNVFDKANVYYLKEISNNEDNFSLTANYQLMKNYNIIFHLAKPIIMGYFLDCKNIYLQTYDSYKIERFDFINGPWPPIEEAYILNIENANWLPLYIKEPWRNGSFFIKSKIRNINNMFIPSISN